jgi:hypothetical protein
MLKDNRFVLALIILIVLFVLYMISRIQFGDKTDGTKIKTEKIK